MARSVNNLPIEINIKPWIKNLVCKSRVEFCPYVHRKWDQLLSGTVQWLGVNHQIFTTIYFCVANITWIDRRNLSKRIYPEMQSAISPFLSSSDESVSQSQPSTFNPTSQEDWHSKGSYFYCSFEPW